MSIDIDSLTEEQLIDINHRIVERLRFLSQARAHSRMLEFKIGDRVVFHPADRPVIEGMLTRYNRKTVTVTTDSRERWNVAPNLLKRVEQSEKVSSREDVVISIRKK